MKAVCTALHWTGSLASPVAFDSLFGLDAVLTRDLQEVIKSWPWAAMSASALCLRRPTEPARFSSPETFWTPVYPGICDLPQQPLHLVCQETDFKHVKCRMSTAPFFSPTPLGVRDPTFFQHNKQVTTCCPLRGAPFGMKASPGRTVPCACTTRQTPQKKTPALPSSLSAFPRGGGGCPSVRTQKDTIHV